MRISSHAYDNGLPAPLAELVIVAGPGDVPAAPPAARSLRLQDPPVEREIPVPLREIRVDGSLSGSIARLRIEQRFELPDDPDRRPLDARYRFPIPGDAAVQGVTMRFGDEEVRAVLRERQVARDEYEHARATGRAAVLVNDSGRGVLTLEVTGITPGIPLVAITDLVAVPRLEADGSAVLRIPLTAAPRYTRGDEDPTALEASPVAIATAVPFGVTLHLRVPAGVAISSPTHPLAITAEDGAQAVRFAGDVTPDRDLVIVARPAAGDSTRGSVLLGETRDGRTPWLATIVAPAVAPVRLPRSLILLVDRSGSMGGPKWAAAEWAVRSLIAGCREDDSLEVLAFDTEIERSSPGLLPMDTPARAAAVDWIRGIEPRGGTELGPSLEEALRTRPRPGAQPELLIVTDGQVSDAARVLALVDETPWRVSVLCIDSAPNAALVTTLAERGGGESWFLTSGAAGDEITDAVDRVTAFFATPAVGDLVLWTPTPGRAFGRRGREGGGGLGVEIGALPAGAVRLVAGWTDGEPAGFRLEGGAAVGLDVVPGRDPAVNALVAAAEIRVLEQAMHLAGWGGSADLALAEAARAGVDPTSLPAGTSVYPPIPGSRRDAPLAGALRALVVERSLAGGVVSSLTAFVGVRRKVGGVSGERVEVPSALPAGWDESFARVASPKMAYASAPPMSGGTRVLRRAMPSSMTRRLADVAPDGPSTGRARSRRPDRHVSPTPTPRTAEFRLSVADLRVGVTLTAPEGEWTAIRVTATLGDTSGAYLVIWDLNRTRPLLRARLADLLAAGERPARLRFAAGATMGIALEGGTLSEGDLVVELVGA